MSQTQTPSSDPQPRRTTTTYVAPARRTIRIALPAGWGRGVLAGVEAAFTGWALITLFVGIAYFSLRGNTWMNDTTPRDALGLGGDLWAALLGGTSHVGDASYRAIPTLAGVGMIALTRALLRSTRGFPRSSAWLSIPGFLVTSWLLAGASGVASHWWTTTVGGVLIPFLAALWFVISEYRNDEDAPELQPWISGGLRLGALMVCVTVGVSALASLVAIIAGWSRIAGIHELLLPASGLDSFFIIVAQVLFAPNLFAWVAAWWAGPGIFTATDAMYTPSAIQSGPIPPLPLLGALPESAPGTWVVIAPVAVGIAVGVCALRWFKREHLLHQSAQGLLASLLFTGVIALWMWSATMSLGSLRLAFMGPRIGWVTLMLALEVALVQLTVSVAGHPTTLALVRAGGQRLRERTNQGDREE